MRCMVSAVAIRGEICVISSSDRGWEWSKNEWLVDWVK